MELQDCALPLLREVIPTADPAVGFKDVDAAFLVGAMPRKEGMERKDLLAANVKIFKAQVCQKSTKNKFFCYKNGCEYQGQALDQHAKKTVKVLVVGNPANTNSLICSKYAPSIPPANFSAMTRLDQNRAQAQVMKMLELPSDHLSENFLYFSKIANRLGVPVNNVNKVTIWGNHSSTQFPDVANATVVTANGETKSVADAINDQAWLNGDFISVSVFHFLYFILFFTINIPMSDG